MMVLNKYTIILATRWNARNSFARDKYDHDDLPLIFPRPDLLRYDENSQIFTDENWCVLALSFPNRVPESRGSVCQQHSNWFLKGRNYSAFNKRNL